MVGLAAEAARKALEMAKVNPDDVDLVLLCTSTPENLFGSAAQVLFADCIIFSHKSWKYNVMDLIVCSKNTLFILAQNDKSFQPRHIIIINESFEFFVFWQASFKFLVVFIYYVTYGFSIEYVSAVSVSRVSCL